MVVRENRATGEEFWGCSMFRITGCKGKPVAQPVRSGTPPLPNEQIAPWE